MNLLLRLSPALLVILVAYILLYRESLIRYYRLPDSRILYVLAGTNFLFALAGFMIQINLTGPITWIWFLLAVILVALTFWLLNYIRQSGED